MIQSYIKYKGEVFKVTKNTRGGLQIYIKYRGGIKSYTKYKGRYTHSYTKYKGRYTKLHKIQGEVHKVTQNTKGGIQSCTKYKGRYIKLHKIQHYVASMPDGAPCRQD